MMKTTFWSLLIVTIACHSASAENWPQFRGPTGQGTSTEKGLPTEWGTQKKIVWKLPLPGPGASSPVVLGDKLFITSYSGYGLDTKEPGKMEDLKRHLQCVDRRSGKVIWQKEFLPTLPEHKYAGEGAYHGYAASTPLTDGERLYVFFGKSGVFCFDLDGKELWNVSVGKGTNGWGSGASPMLWKDLLIINASVESGSMFALDKVSGKEVWKAPKIGAAWNMPVLVVTPAKEEELVLSVQGRVAGFDPATGKELWSAAGHKGYVCPSVVANDGVVYAIGGGGTSLAVKAGGRGDVTDTHVLWRTSKGSNASSPIYHAGNIYWANEGGGTVHCQDAATGKIIEAQRLSPDAGRIWASPVLADGNLYYVTQFKGVFVVRADPKFQIVAHNTFTDDASRSNASIAISNGQLFLRTDSNLYCIGKK